MTQSLKGLRVLNTRPQAQAQLLKAQIESAGGISIDYPTLDIQPTDTDWVNSLPNLDGVEHAIFVSSNAVTYCFNALQEQHLDWPQHINVIAIGNGSAAALCNFNIQAHDLPQHPDSEHLLALDSLQQLENKTVLLFKGEGGRQLIEHSIEQNGAKLFIMPVYKRVVPLFNHQFTNTLWHDDGVDIILLTSEQSINNLFHLFSKKTHYWLKNKPFLVISERLAKSAASLGIKKILISHPERMIKTLFDYYQGLIHGQ